jgi:hypothetical protein
VELPHRFWYFVFPGKRQLEVRFEPRPFRAREPGARRRRAPTVTYQNFFNAASLPIVLPAGLTWGVSPDIGTPYSMIYLFNIQRQLGKSSTLEVYNGAGHRHLQNQNNGAGLLHYNAPGVPPGTNVAPERRAPYHEFPAGIELTEDGGRGSYNGLSVKVEPAFQVGPDHPDQLHLVQGAR